MGTKNLAARASTLAGFSGGGAALCALYFLYYSSGSAWIPFFNVYLRDIGLSGLQVGLLAGIRPAVMLVSQPLWGVGADFWGRRRTLLTTMLVSAFLLLGYALGVDFRFLLFWTIVYTFISNPIGSLIDSLVLDHLEERPDLTFGRLRMWGGVGWATAALVVGSAIVGQDQRLIFVFGAALSLIGWAVAARTTRATHHDNSTRRSWAGLGRLLRNRRLIGLLALVALLQLGAASIFTFFPVYMNELGASSRLLGLAFTIQGLSEMPLFLAGAAIIRRIGAARTLVFTFLVFAARAFLYSYLRTPAAAVLVELSHGLSFSLFLVAAVDYVNKETPSAWRATGQSLFWAAYFGAGSIAGNLWAGFLYDQLGVQLMFRANGFVILGVAVVAWFVLRGGDSRTMEED